MRCARDTSRTCVVEDDGESIEPCCRCAPHVAIAKKARVRNGWLCSFLPNFGSASKSEIAAPIDLQSTRNPHFALFTLNLAGYCLCAAHHQSTCCHRSDREQSARQAFGTPLRFNRPNDEAKNYSHQGSASDIQEVDSAILQKVQSNPKLRAADFAEDVAAG